MLRRQGLKEEPPQLVHVSFSGHTMQMDANVYLLPAGADPESPDSTPDKEFVTLSDVWKFCHELDEHARKLSPPREVAFSTSVDGCRVGSSCLDTANLSSTLDPTRSKAPKKWALCFSCSKDSVAMDGAAGHHSPFTDALLHPEEGLFAKGVSVKKALEGACQRLSRTAGDTGQAPVSVGLDNLADDLCFAPLPADASRVSDSRPVVDDDCNEVVKLLKDKELGEMAVHFCNVMRMRSLSQLRRLQEEDLDDPELSFLKRWEKKTLIEIVRDVTACAASLNTSVLSGDGTATQVDDSASEISLSKSTDNLGAFSDLQSPSDSPLSHEDTESARGVDSQGGDDLDLYFETVAAKHPGNPEDFQAHMQGFIREFLAHTWLIEAAIDEATESFVAAHGLPESKMTYCMFLWMRIARDVRQVDADRVG